MYRKTLAALSRALQKNEISSMELTQLLLDRCRTRNPELNCFITLTPEQALEQAKRADARIKAGLATPLTGIPIAHKDIFCTMGVKTTCGDRKSVV